jgi:drug/metabolite transporter (DMT)-like permease
VTARGAAGTPPLAAPPARAEPLPVVARIMARPGLAAVAGALTIAFSAILVRLADVSPATAAIFRCAYALPVLGALAVLEDRRFGPRPARDRRLALPAGAFFAADLIFWHYAIADVGAGLATVLGNVQVVVIPFAAWAVLGERIERRILLALPLVCSGVLLISGALETGAYGDDPARGVVFGMLTGLAYAGFILVLRQGSGDLRRPAGPLFDATAVATVVAIAAGLAVGDADLVPSWPAHGWLLALALSSQVLGWLLITVSLPRLPAALTSVTLTIQPVGSVLLGVILLAEEPSALQLAGVACIVAGLVSVARRRSASGREAL